MTEIKITESDERVTKNRFPTIDDIVTKHGMNVFYSQNGRRDYLLVCRNDTFMNKHLASKIVMQVWKSKIYLKDESKLDIAKEIAEKLGIIDIELE
jgi:hypothetical protein